MEIPLLDLKAQYATIRDDVLAAVAEVLESQVCVGGPRVAELERQIAGFCGCRHAVAVSSGTDAILCTLMSLGIGPGDEVITTPFTFFATAGCIARVGATPVFVDIDARTFNIDTRLIEAAITGATRAIIPVHLFGQMCHMDAVMEIAGKHGLAVIEDAAQAIGATYRGRRAGSIGTAGCFSFYPSKNLGAAGDAGMITTNDSLLCERLQSMRNHGASGKYIHPLIGGNFRLDPIQAAVLSVKLPHLENWSAARRRNAAFYDRAFVGSHVRTPCIAGDCVSIFNQYVVRVPNRDRVMEALKAKGIGTEVYYPVPLHRQECFRNRCRVSGSLIESEAAAESVLALPVYPELTAETLAIVAEAVLAAAKGC